MLWKKNDFVFIICAEVVITIQVEQVYVMAETSRSLPEDCQDCTEKIYSKFFQWFYFHSLTVILFRKTSK